MMFYMYLASSTADPFSGLFPQNLSKTLETRLQVELFEFHWQHFFFSKQDFDPVGSTFVRVRGFLFRDACNFTLQRWSSILHKCKWREDWRGYFAVNCTMVSLRCQIDHEPSPDKFHFLMRVHALL